MDPYKVKHYLWAVIIALMVVVGLLSGCSSAPKVQASKPQYCHTSQAIVTKNGEKVESATLVECTDDQFKRLTAVRMGVADHCGYSTRTISVGGKLVETQFGSCQILDRNGNVIGWEYINN